MRNYTPPEGSVLRPAGGVSASAPVGAELTSTGRHAPCGKRMIARRFLICSNHHRGSYTSPALAAASYPFVDLPPGSTLRCKLFRSASLKFIHKFSVDTQSECEYNVLVHTVHFKVKAVKHGNHNQQ